MFQRQMELQEPFRQGGLTAQQEIMQLLGIGGDKAAAGYGKLLHGEAISLGLRAAAWLSAQIADLTAEDYERVVALLKLFDLPVRLTDDFNTETIMRIARMDKKFENGKIRFVLLRKIGDAYVSKDVLEGHLKQALDELRK
jgi:3-dehydroquinate synthase